MAKPMWATSETAARIRNSTRADGYWKFKDKRLAIYAKSELSIHDRHLAATALVEWRTARFDYGDPK